MQWRCTLCAHEWGVQTPRPKPSRASLRSRRARRRAQVVAQRADGRMGIRFPAGPTSTVAAFTEFVFGSRLAARAFGTESVTVDQFIETYVRRERRFK